jgi:N-acetylglucosamine-6-phosphate deacetylase
VASQIYIRDAKLLTPGTPGSQVAVLVEAGRIAAVAPAQELPPPADARIIEAGGLLLAPGFIDLQLNGGFGRDFTAEPESIWQVAERLPQYGVTSFLPTIITAPPEAAARAQAVLAAGPPAGFSGAWPLGLHLEGPFLNPAKRGAHNPAHLRAPDLAAIADWSPGSGVRLVTLAPELPGALEVIRTLWHRGVVVSAGHSLANAAEARRGFEAGIRYGTHLFNAMPPLDHRTPGLAGALLTEPSITAGIIADGVHVHPDMLRLAWLAKGPARLNLVTDAMAALGMPPGSYRLGDLDVSVDATTARLADGRLAGSVLSLDRALRVLVEAAGCSPAQAVATVTSTPAEVLGEAGAHGRVAPGCAADLVLLTPDLQVRATIAAGEVVFSAP